MLPKNKNLKKTESFVVWDCIEVANSLGYKNTENLIRAQIKEISEKYNKYKFFINAIDCSYNKIINPKTNKKKILFFNKNYHKPLILKLKKHYDICLIVYGIKDRLFAIRNKIPYVSVLHLYPLLDKYFDSKNVLFLENMIEQAEEFLSASKSDYIVLTNDSLSVERAIILGSKKSGIPAIDIFHGVGPIANKMTDGQVADYIWVWGNYLRNAYIKQKFRKAEEIYVFGYPYIFEETKNSGKKDGYVLYYLGNGFGLHGLESLLEFEINILKEVIKICSKLNVDLYYRPHPGDECTLQRENFPNLKITPKNEKLEDAFGKGDIFISHSSTSLIEATIRSKLTIQIMGAQTDCDNFEKVGGCTKTVKTAKELKSYLKKITTSKLPEAKINKNYVDTTRNPVDRFIEIIEDIEKQKSKS